MYSGKLTFSTPSTQKKSCSQSVGGRRKDRANAYCKKKFTANEWVEKKLMPTTIHITLTSPAPTGNLSGWPLDVFGPLFWRKPLWFDSCKGPPPVSNHLILSFWFFSHGKFKCSTSHLLSHIKNGSACFKHFSSHISCKMNLYSGDTNKGLLDAH